MALAQVLSPLAGMFDASLHPNLLVGLAGADDAAVYRIDDETAVVATLDFFAPVVDDARQYGGIAAANAMSDVYAMGGEVVLALNIAAFPEDLPVDVASEILIGAAEKVREAGGVVAGGHTVWDPEPKFGLSVMGLVHPRRILSKSGLRAGDVVYLTKPLGTGTLLSAAKQGAVEPLWLESATESMLRLNRHASHLAGEAGLVAATDITGFGLVGHLWEMAERSGVAVTIDSAAVPLLAGARESVAKGFHTAGEGRNREWVGSHLAVAEGLDADTVSLLFDPQTSGGLLLAASRERAVALEAAFRRDGEPLFRIGEVFGGPAAIQVS